MSMTQVSSVDSVVAAYNLAADLALRPVLYFDQVATVKPTHQAHQGGTVVFTLWDDLAPNVTPLTETSDVNSVAMSDTQVTVTLAEYGNAVTTTAKLRGTGFLGYDADAAEKIGWNAGLSVDRLARTELQAGSNVRYAGNATARNTVGPDDTIDGDDTKYAAAKLRGANAPGWNGMSYAGFIHPDVSYDYRSSVGTNDWDDAAIRNEGGARVWNGQIGRHNGIDWIETPTAPFVADAGSSTTLTDVYLTLVVGKGCLAKAYSRTESAERPQVRVGPVTDKLSRFHHVGWYWLGGYKRYREECIYRIEASSSIGANA